MQEMASIKEQTSASDNASAEPVVWKSDEPLPRSSHVDFFNNRDWQSVQTFWSTALKSSYEREGVATDGARSRLPPFITGDEKFSWTNLHSLHKVSEESGEFQSTDQKYSSRYTYALTIGYDGSRYNGYQQQKGSDLCQIRTVEDDVEFLLRRKVVVAGRTDKDVSAMSQVISFHNHDQIDQSEAIMNMIQRRMSRFDESMAAGTQYISDDELSTRNGHNEDTTSSVQKLSKKKAKQQEKLNKKLASFPFSLPISFLSGKIRVWDCKRVSRKFHPIFSTTWRRYVFLFPCCEGNFEGVDVDVNFVRRCFAR